MLVRSFMVASGFLGLWHPAAWAASFAVSVLTDGVDAAPGNGICATARGSCTLRAAIQEANALPGSDQVNLGIGVHELTIAGDDEDHAATGDLDITDDLTLAGVNAYLTAIDANSIDRVLDQVHKGGPSITLTIRDLTLTGGSTTDRGGGLRYARNVVADRIIVTRNNASAGGGLAATEESAPWLDLSTSIVSLNTAGDGGGIDAAESFKLSVDLSIIIANTAARYGGGVNFTFTQFPSVFDKVTVYGNNVTGGNQPRGGGIRNESELLLDQSWIGHNLVGTWGAAAPTAGGRGGGLYFAVGENDITNSTIEGNLAAEGGAIGTQGYLNIKHATIARNRATRGGALLGIDVGTFRLWNTIVGENVPANCAATVIFEQGPNLETTDSSCNLGGFDDDVNLEPLGYYGGPTRTMPPLPDSAAVEGGDDAGVNVDQRGVLRPQLAQFDLGAVELQGRRALPQYTGGSTSNLHSCDRNRDGRVDFRDLDRLIASFRVHGGQFQGNAAQRLRTCVAACTHAGCPPVAIIRKPAAQS